MAKTRAIAATVVLMLVFGYSACQDLDIVAQHYCTNQPGNVLSMELRVYDRSGIARRMHAVDGNVAIISSCSVNGLGNSTSPYVVETTFNIADESLVNNDCGMTSEITGGVLQYVWRFKVYAHLATDLFSRKGLILTAICPSGTTNGVVSTIIEHADVSTFTVSAVNPSDVTGLNSIATNAQIRYDVVLYPNSDRIPIGLKNAKGIYYYNCNSATSADLIDNRELFIDENGCPFPGATFAPNGGGFKEITNTGGLIELSARIGTSTVVNGQKTIYFQCSIGVCDNEDDIFCEDRCQAHLNGEVTNAFRRNGVATKDTSFIVQDIQASIMFPARPNGNPAIAKTNRNSPISIVAKSSPNGIGASSEMQNANGFYVYNCEYALTENMNPSVQFVDNNGCRKSGTKVVMSDEFSYNEANSAPNVFVTMTGNIDVRAFEGNVRIYVRCSTGKCTTAGHPYCTSQRCGSQASPDNTQDLGYQGLNFTLSIIDPNVKAMRLQVIGPNGNILNEGSTVKVGDTVGFKVQVTPGGSGTGDTEYDNAKGIFIYNCYARTSTGEEDKFLDANGCQVEGSKYKLTGQCRDATVVDGVEPFVVDCGGYLQPNEGEITTECQVGYCTTTNNPYCENRCAAGDITPGSNTVLQVLPVRSTYKAVEQNPGRTAIKSEEIDDIITAVSVVAALFVLAVTCIGTFVIIRKQRMRAKNFEDNRSYNY